MCSSQSPNKVRSNFTKVFFHPLLHYIDFNLVQTALHVKLLSWDVLLVHSLFLLRDIVAHLNMFQKYFMKISVLRNFELHCNDML